MSFNNEEDNSTRNMMIAIVAFMALMFGYNYFFDSKVTPSEENAIVDEEDQQASDDQTAESPEGNISVETALASQTKVSIENQNLIADVDLTGAVIDGITLKHFKQNVDENSKNVMLLTPRGTDSEYFYSISYKDKANGESVSEKSVWSVVQNDKNKLILKTSTAKGISVEREIAIDDGYVLNVKDKITNLSDGSLKLSKKAALVRVNPVKNNYAVVHEGLVFNIKKNPQEKFFKNVTEVKYSDIDKKELLPDCQWIGYTDIYWLCSILNKYDKNSSVSYSKFGDDSYNISLYSKKDINVEKGKSVELNYGLFAGPKDIGVLRSYSQSLHLDKFEMSIDFGWFFMITKPLVQFMEILQKLFLNMGLVILFLTLLFKVITYPLMKKSFESAAKMREVQPKIAALQKIYAHDKLRMNQEMMALYKKEKISPMSGCLPMLLQAPIFFCLYKVFFISINMRHAPLFGWIHDLSAPDQLYIFNLFGLLDFDLPGFLRIGVWPLIMGATMILQQKLASATSAQKNVEKTQEMKMQEKMMFFMPVLFTYICASFPVGVVIYWTISNIFSMVQQHYANKKAARR